MNAMQELIIFSDGDGKLIGSNLALEKFINKKQKDILGKRACQLLPKTLCNALVNQSKQAYVATTATAYQQVIKMNDRTYELFSRKFFNDVGETLGTINIFRDVTQVYAIQDALEQAKNQAEYANKIKGQFLANMSHEIRTPINAIQGMMYLLAKTTLNRVQKQYLSNAETASVSLLYLIDELLDLAKIEAGKMPIVKSQVLIDDVIDKALKLNIAKANNKHLPILINIALDVPQYIYTDEVRLVQVLTNLINNAVKFTSQGEIKVIVNKTMINNDEYLRCMVIDSGIGIAKDKQGSLFNAFTQADESMTRKYGGSGLGLSICRQIINLLAGELTLESELGKVRSSD
jgi:signal transduction histidine kinase